jgi:hypothetical protein
LLLLYRYFWIVFLLLDSTHERPKLAGRFDAIFSVISGRYQVLYGQFDRTGDFGLLLSFKNGKSIRKDLGDSAWITCIDFDKNSPTGRSKPCKLTQSVIAALLDLHHLQCTQSIAGVLRNAFAVVGADEGTIWLLDEKQEALVPVWSSGPYGERFVGIHRQPLTAGLMSLICITEQALCENAVYQNAQQDPTLDRRLGVLTCAMIAVPLRFRDAIHGGVSCVRLKPVDAAAPEPPPFSATDLAVVTDAVREVERLVEAA